MENHPDYDAAPEEQRWSRAEREIFPHLSYEAWRRRGRWATYILPSGTWVEMRIRDHDFRHELRLSRREAPESWGTEVDRLLGMAVVKPSILGWYSSTEKRFKQGVVSTFLALFPLETEPGRVKCDTCGSINATGDLCSFCEMGREGKRMQARMAT
jgi:hypothetical protein